MPNILAVLENRSWTEELFALPEHLIEDILQLKNKQLSIRETTELSIKEEKESNV